MGCLFVKFGTCCFSWACVILHCFHMCPCGFNVFQQFHAMSITLAWILAVCLRVSLIFCGLVSFGIASAAFFHDSLRLSFVAHGSQWVSMKSQGFAHDSFKPFGFLCLSLILQCFPFVLFSNCRVDSRCFPTRSKIFFEFRRTSRFGKQYSTAFDVATLR